MRGGNQPRRLLRILNLRQGHVELHGKLETTLRSGKQAHAAVDRDVTHLDPLAARHRAESTLEARRKAHCEELFRVRAAAFAAHLLGRADLHIQGSVTRSPVTVCATARDRRLRRVKNSYHTILRPLSWKRMSCCRRTPGSDRPSD